MHRWVVDIPARPALTLVGIAAICLALARESPAQSLISSSTVSNVNITPITVPQIVVPRITVPPISVQIRGAKSSASGAKSGSSGVSVSDQTATADEADAEQPDSDMEQPLIFQQSTASRIGVTPPATGSILQLVLATEPGDPVMGPAFPMPPPERLPMPGDQPSTEWSNPYGIGPGSALARTWWQRMVPLGLLPWGPPTPLNQRSKGWGGPLLGTSWLNRPWSAGWFAGGIFGSPLIHGVVNQQGGFYGGYRVGWDYDYYWGLEARLGASSISLVEPSVIGQPGTNDFWNLDLNLHWYPWGDATWRPYASFGFGMANFAFWQPDGVRYDQVSFATPIGVGIKYRWMNWVALRADLMDNVAYSRGVLNTTNNFSFTVGVEMQFGGVRRTYWPWNPGRVIR